MPMQDGLGEPFSEGGRSPQQLVLAAVDHVRNAEGTGERDGVRTDAASPLEEPAGTRTVPPGLA